jgi:DNA-binding beta-propeller fold protein YncE
MTTGKIVRTLPLGQFPRAIIVSRDQQRAYVHNTLSNTVSVIDLAQWKVVKNLVLDGQGRTLSEDSLVPLWFSADGRRLFVLNEPARQVEIYDTSSLAHLKSAIPQTVFQRAAPYAGADKTALALAKDRLLLVDEESLQHRRAWAFCDAIDGGELAGVRDAQGRNLAAVSHRNDTTVYIVNVDSGATIGTYPTASGVVHLEFSPDGQTLYALGENGVLSLIDRDKRMVSEVDLICAPDNH